MQTILSYVVSPLIHATNFNLATLLHFALPKTAYRQQVKRLEEGGVDAISKEHFTSLFKPARERAFTPKNIKASFGGREINCSSWGAKRGEWLWCSSVLQISALSILRIDFPSTASVALHRHDRPAVCSDNQSKPHRTRAGCIPRRRSVAFRETGQL